MDSLGSTLGAGAFGRSAAFYEVAYGPRRDYATADAAQTLARHAIPGGVVVVEPWFFPDVWRVGCLDSVFVNQPDLKLARMHISGVEEGLSMLQFHVLVAISYVGVRPCHQAGSIDPLLSKKGFRRNSVMGPFGRSLIRDKSPRMLPSRGTA